MCRGSVMADGPTDLVMLSERITIADLESDHFRAHLVERLAWAVGDAHAAERDHRETAQSELRITPPARGPTLHDRRS